MTSRRASRVTIAPAETHGPHGGARRGCAPVSLPGMGLRPAHAPHAIFENSFKKRVGGICTAAALQPQPPAQPALGNFSASFPKPTCGPCVWCNPMIRKEFWRTGSFGVPCGPCAGAAATQVGRPGRPLAAPLATPSRPPPRPSRGNSKSMFLIGAFDVFC